MPDYIYMQLIAFLGGFVQGLTGFGVMLVALPLMAFLIDIKTAVPLIILLGMVINAMLMVQLARHFKGGKWLPLILASYPGIPVGIYIHKCVAERPLEILVGIVILVSVAANCLYRKPAKELKQWWAYASGFLSGCLAGSIGASGPPVIVYTAFQPWTRQEIKATLVAFFMINGIGVLGFFLYHGFFTSSVITHFSYCLLPLVLGVLLGSFCYGRVNDTYYRNSVLVLLAALGLLMLLKG